MSPDLSVASNKRFSLGILWFILPLAVWFLIFYPFPIQNDTFHYYNWTKYFMDSLANGEFPQWDPFYAWGSQDDFDMRFVGEFSPLLYLTRVLNAAGVPFPIAYTAYLVIYFILGTTGFYLLAGRLFQDRFYAYLAYVLMIFSSLAVTLLEQLVINHIVFIGVWFLYFLTAFIQTGSKRYLLGVTFTLMLMATTYMPFHFLSIFIPLSIFFMLHHLTKLKAMLRPAANEIINHKSVAVICLLSLLLACLPGAMWVKATQDDAYVMVLDYRSHEGAQSKVSADLHGINIGGIVSEVTWEELFADLDLGHMNFYFVSVFIYIVILLSLINPWNKMLSILFFTFVIVFLQALTDTTPFFRFLYEHVFFYRLFRNYFFFLPLLIPLVTLFAVEQLRLFLRQRSPDRWRNILMCVYVLFIHLAFLLYLLPKEHIIITTYFALAASAILFTSYFLGWGSDKNILFKCALVAIILIQPIEICHHYMQDRHTGVPDLGEHWRPQFSFSRPPITDAKKGYVGYRGSTKRMIDESGFLAGGYFGVKWSYELLRQAAHDKIKGYVKNKFLVYDEVKPVDDNMADLAEMESSMQGLKNVAYAVGVEPRQRSGLKDQSKAQVIESNSEDFQVLDFGLNFIKFRTNFPAEKFVVYNDSYHPKWQAMVNGQRSPLWRTNGAFKGLWLDAGENVVYLKFGNRWQQFLNYFLIIYFALFGGYLCSQFFGQRGSLVK